VVESKRLVSIRSRTFEGRAMSSKGLLVAVTLLVCGCLASRADAPDESAPLAPGALRLTLGPEYDVYEALIRHHMKRLEAGDKKPAVFLVRIAGKDELPAEFLARFAGSRPAVKSLSGKGPGKGVLTVSAFGPVEWQGAGKARVLGTVFESWVPHTCGTPWPMDTRRKGEKWEVVVR
jgi:hypothetical protein